MLDVIHVLFEDDITPQYEDSAKIKSNIRSEIYRILYKREYKYKVKEKPQAASPQEALGFDPGMELPTVPPENQEIKPFIPATNPEDLPGILDAPLN